MDFHGLLKKLEKLTIDNSPAILTAFGVTGTLTTAYLTGRATIKAIEIIEDEKDTRGSEYNMYPPDRTELIKMVWKVYIPPAASAIFSIAAIVGANHVSTRRAKALATAYSISERAFSEYREKIVDKIGENKERKYRDEIAQERVQENPVSDNTVVITDGGDVLCYDHFSGRYFMSSMETIRRAENEVNHQILHDGYASVSDLYFLLGLRTTAISEEVGWNQDKLLNIVYSTVLSEDNRPCISIDYDLHPNRKYSHFAGG